LATAASISLTATNGTTLAGNTGNPIITTNSALITKYTIANTNTFPVFLKFYDSPNATITNLFGAYTNSTLVSSNYVVIYTNIVGVAETNTNAIVVSLSSITAAALREQRVVWTYQVQTSNTVTYTPAYAHTVSQGLMVTNNGNVQLTIEYLPLR
jgi:hypothetical protein